MTKRVFPIEDISYRDTGISLRDWFAGQAIAGLLANSSRSGLPKEFAHYAYEIADAAMKKREE